MHRPACICEFKSAFLDKGTGFFFLLVGLTLPPHGEELHLNLGEAFLWVSCQLNHYCVNDVFYICHGDILSRAGEVLIDSLEPTDIVMTVWDDMHV